MSPASRYEDPPFRISRTSHVRLTVKDLKASLHFYTELAGMAVSAVEDGTAYLRGAEEIGHHSVVLRESGDEPRCDAIGFRVFNDAELDKAKAYFDGLGAEAEWVKRPHEERTLAVKGPGGIPFELTGRMETRPRLTTEYLTHRAKRALRMDHFQVVVPDIGGTGDAFLDMGFRASELIIQTETGKKMGIFLHRKNNPHDLVLSLGAGPRLHHFAIVVSDLQAMIGACDLAGALGIGQEVERGPGRHGPGNGMFTYFRDPDGHRMELILAPMQYMDVEEETRVWSSAEKHMIVPWGQGAPKRWLEEATHFTGVPLDTSENIARWSSR
jgi:catechol 2,3-dioxygenase